MSAICLPIILFVIPQMYKSRVENEAELVLKRNNYQQFEKYGDYSYIYEQLDYIVTGPSGEVDTIGVCLHKGEVVVTSTIEFKKTLPGKMIGM